MPVCKQCEAEGNLGRTCRHGGTWDLPGITHWDGCGNMDRPEHRNCPATTRSVSSTPAWSRDNHYPLMQPTLPPQYVCGKCREPWPCPDKGKEARETLLITREALDNFNLWVREAQQLRPILTDLIAELRRTTKGYLSPRAYAITVEQQREMADAAEAQLREAMRNDE